MLRFTLFRIPVSIHWMFWVIALLLGTGFQAGGMGPGEGQRLLAWVPAVFISVLAHEMGHALLFRKFGGRPSIMLYGMGGFASAPGKYTRPQMILIAAAGPAVGFAIWLLTKHFIAPTAIQANFLVRVFVGSMIAINFWWSLLNLFPVLPLDGGRIFEAVVGGHNHRVVGLVGMVTAIVGAAWAFQTGFLIFPILLGFLAFQNFQRSQGKHPRYF